MWLDGRTAEIQPVTTVFVGEGSYEGWTVVTEMSDAGTQWAFDGVIFEGALPPAP